MKTRPTSLRFNENDLLLALNKSGIKKTQKLMDFLLSEYVREFKPTFIPLPEDYINVKNVAIIDEKGKITALTKEVISKSPKDWQSGVKALLRENPENKNILGQIEAIKAEKIPKERDTQLGRKYWAIDQQKRILELEKQIIS